MLELHINNLLRLLTAFTQTFNQAHYAQHKQRQNQLILQTTT